MLDRQEDGLIIRREAGSTHLSPRGRLIKKPRQRAAMAGCIGGIKRIRHAGSARRAIGRNPDAPLAVEGAIIGAGKPAAI